MGTITSNFTLSDQQNTTRSENDIVKVISTRYNIVSSGGSLDCDSLTDVVVVLYLEF